MTDDFSFLRLRHQLGPSPANNFRQFAEESDLLQGVQLSLDISTGFAAMACEMLGEFKDDYPKGDSISIGLMGGLLGGGGEKVGGGEEETDAARNMREISVSFRLSLSLSFCFHGEGTPRLEAFCFDLAIEIERPADSFVTTSPSLSASSPRVKPSRFSSTKEQLFFLFKHPRRPGSLPRLLPQQLPPSTRPTPALVFRFVLLLSLPSSRVLVLANQLTFSLYSLPTSTSPPLSSQPISPQLSFLFVSKPIESASRPSFKNSTGEEIPGSSVFPVEHRYGT